MTTPLLVPTLLAQKKNYAFNGKYARYEKRAIGFYKRRLLERLGAECVCCGETQPEFLTLDHINGGGKEHRRKYPSMKTRFIYRDVLAEKNPREKYRILCWNCNCATSRGQVCPHNREEVERFLNICQELLPKLRYA